MTTIAKYISRFRHDSPRSRRERRMECDLNDIKKDFWWINDLRGQLDGERSAELSKRASYISSESDKSATRDDRQIILEALENTPPASLYKLHIGDNQKGDKDDSAELKDPPPNSESEQESSESEIPSDSEMSSDPEILSESDCASLLSDGEPTTSLPLSAEMEEDAEKVIERVRKRLGLFCSHAAISLANNQFTTHWESEHQFSLKADRINSNNLPSIHHMRPCVCQSSNSYSVETMEETSSVDATRHQPTAAIHGRRWKQAVEGSHNENMEDCCARPEIHQERPDSELDAMRNTFVVTDSSVQTDEQVDAQVTESKCMDDSAVECVPPEIKDDSNTDIWSQENEKKEVQDVTVMDTLDTLVNDVVRSWSTQNSPNIHSDTKNKLYVNVCHTEEISDCLSDGSCKPNKDYVEYDSDAVHEMLTHDPVIRELQQLLLIYKHALLRLSSGPVTTVTRTNDEML